MDTFKLLQLDFCFYSLYVPAEADIQPIMP